MRGKVYMSRYYLQTVRITPAYAGKRQVRCSYLPSCEDHPRLCGEKPYRQKIHHRVSRITPAYAGKSTGTRLFANIDPDHPRLCGEKIRLMYEGLAPIGSPPPMRGKANLVWCTQCENRITPAYAGKSKSRRWEDFVKRDHPRLCGEKFGGQVKCACSKGSPPPMRGKVSERNLLQRKQGITPAYAGKSLRLLSFSLPDQDHPRLCGEKLHF